MIVEQDLVFVGTSRYSFTPDGSKDELKGCKLIAINCDDGDLVKENSYGYITTVLNADYSLYSQFCMLTPLESYKFKLDVTIDGKKNNVRLLGLSDG